MWRRSEKHPESNSGVVNYGPMGNVQNQPGASNSQQSQTNSGAGRDLGKEFDELLGRIQRQLTAEREHIAEYDECVVLFGLVTEQQLNDVVGRRTATYGLEKIKAKCDAVPGLVQLSTAALSVIAAFA